MQWQYPPLQTDVFPLEYVGRRFLAIIIDGIIITGIAWVISRTFYTGTGIAAPVAGDACGRSRRQNSGGSSTLAVKSRIMGRTQKTTIWYASTSSSLHSVR